jgi:hypothetical protein
MHFKPCAGVRLILMPRLIFGREWLNKRNYFTICRTVTLRAANLAHGGVIVNKYRAASLRPAQSAGGCGVRTGRVIAFPQGPVIGGCRPLLGLSTHHRQGKAPHVLRAGPFFVSRVEV